MTDFKSAAYTNFAMRARCLSFTHCCTPTKGSLSGDFFGAFGGKSSEPKDVNELVRRMEREEFDLIAVGRAILADPDWVSKIKGTNAEPRVDFTPSAFRELV